MYFRTLVLTGLIVSYISASPADNSLYTARLNSLMQTISETAQPSGGDTITISSAIEEHESFVISIKSKTAQSGISVMPLSGHPGNLDIKYVEFAPLDSLNTRRSPLFLKPYSSPLPSSTAAITYFVITAKSNSRTDTGSFNVKLKVEGGSTACTLNVKWRIRPYSLRQFTDFSCGAFVGSYRTINQATANDMKAHGVDAVQFFLGYGSVYPGIYSSDTSIQVINDNGHLKVEFHAFDSLLKFMKNAGMRGPVTPSIGNDRTAHLERDICMAFPQFKLDTGA
ncbi:MAG: hypothetical protein JNL74_23040, partial [Fibrobacteres bacterium]|nr:hypothetical protein [Fibrobacterota bacterium]